MDERRSGGQEWIRSTRSSPAATTSVSSGVSLHASLQGALDAARELAHSDEDGIVYTTSKEGSYEHGWFWKAPFSGHYIAVQAKPLLI